MGELERELTDTTLTDTVFLRVLVKGGLSLYQFTDAKQHFYIKEEGKEYQELFYKVYLVDRDSRLLKQYIFRDQLRAMISSTSNGPALISLLRSIHYREHDLVKVIEKMNGILDKGAISYKVAKQKRLVSFFAGAGIVYSSIKYSGEPDNLSNLNYSKSVQPLIVGGVDLAMARNLQRIKLRFEMAWYKLKYVGSNNASSADSVRYHLGVSTISPSVCLVYNVLNYPRHKLYLGGGIQFNFSSYPENILHKKFGNTPNSILTRSPHLSLEKTWLAINGKAGFTLNNKFEIAGTITFGSFANFSLFSLSPTSVSGSLNYRF